MCAVSGVLSTVDSIPLMIGVQDLCVICGVDIAYGSVIAMVGL